MNNHFSPKAPKPLLWPQPTFFWPQPTFFWPQPTFFGLPAASSVAAPFLCSPSLFFCAHILSLPRPSQRLVEPVAPEKPPPCAKPPCLLTRASTAPLSCAKPPYLLTRASTAPLPCAKPPYLLTRASSSLLPCAKPPCLLTRVSTAPLPCAKPPCLLTRASTAPLPCAKPPYLLPRPSSSLLPCAKPPDLLPTCKIVPVASFSPVISITPSKAAGKALPRNMPPAVRWSFSEQAGVLTHHHRQSWPFSP